ncbi:MAG TPA: hypothetical protein VGU61_06310 [Noviherbaspirillum sp.]|uniref:hypothetical protein n=1 Tax=Noviherbaspirillum sp. TaxID=1926288 RepID=UPI002DDCAA30|nr:hypothetical protein [Noviherbaspirillum sp.]HEV2609861.1 hypothetical protein [Noviherbaspirillum sp.]
MKIFKENERKLLLEISTRIYALYCSSKDPLAGKDCEVTEHEDDKVISLARAFRKSYFLFKRKDFASGKLKRGCPSMNSLIIKTDLERLIDELKVF